jgi:hypothetical protein
MGKFSEAFISANVVLTAFCGISCLYLLCKYGKREAYTFITLLFLALTNLCKSSPRIIHEPIVRLTLSLIALLTFAKISTKIDLTELWR